MGFSLKKVAKTVKKVVTQPKETIKKAVNVVAATGTGLLAGGVPGAVAAAARQTVRESKTGKATALNFRNIGQSAVTGAVAGVAYGAASKAVSSGALKGGTAKLGALIKSGGAASKTGTLLKSVGNLALKSAPLLRRAGSPAEAPNFEDGQSQNVPGVESTTPEEKTQREKLRDEIYAGARKIGNSTVKSLERSSFANKIRGKARNFTESLEEKTGLRIEAPASETQIPQTAAQYAEGSGFNGKDLLVPAALVIAALVIVPKLAK